MSGKEVQAEPKIEMATRRCLRMARTVAQDALGNKSAAAQAFDFWAPTVEPEELGRL
jgi:hypothetical protein